MHVNSKNKEQIQKVCICYVTLLCAFDQLRLCDGLKDYAFEKIFKNVANYDRVVN